MKPSNVMPEGKVELARDTRFIRRVVLESPYAGDIKRNILYARRAVVDCISRGESPIASHLLFPDFVLHENIHEARRLGIDLGLAWHHGCDAVVFYADLGFSPGMDAARTHCMAHGIHWEIRYIEPLTPIKAVP